MLGEWCHHLLAFVGPWHLLRAASICYALTVCMVLAIYLGN